MNVGFNHNSWNKFMGKPSFKGNVERMEVFPTVLVLSDMDGTWLCKDKKAREELDNGIQELIKTYDNKGLNVLLGYVTANLLQD